MKFAISAVVLFALTIVTAHASILPLSVGLHGATVVQAVPGAVALGHGGPVQIISGPAVVPAVVAVAPAVEGTYVAKTRGAVHVAPLAGHANSAASVNLEPAPGTL